MRKELKVDSLYFTTDEYKGHESLTIHFEVIQGDLLRATKEYSLTYVSKTDEWFGDVIAYGHWWDLSAEEIRLLRLRYNLDMRVMCLAATKLPHTSICS